MFRLAHNSYRRTGDDLTGGLPVFYDRDTFVNANVFFMFMKITRGYVYDRRY